MPQINEMPYFMTNDEWYEQRPNEDGTYELVLTDKAPELARLSYEEYMEKYEELENVSDVFVGDDAYEREIDKLFGF